MLRESEAFFCVFLKSPLQVTRNFYIINILFDFYLGGKNDGKNGF